MLPTEDQIAEACKAARRAIEAYSSFDNSMIPDDALESVVVAALTAALSVRKPEGN